jgi:hypothetical protein
VYKEPEVSLFELYVNNDILNISAEERQYVDPVELRQYVNPVEIDPSQMTLGQRNIHSIFEEKKVDEEERITSYPITLHGGPVMATPSI